MEAQGFKGSIWLLWHTENFSISILQERAQFLHVKVRNQNNVEWLLTVLYRNTTSPKGRCFWDNVKAFADNITEPWILLGDFNVIASSQESSGMGVLSTKNTSLPDGLVN